MPMKRRAQALGTIWLAMLLAAPAFESIARADEAPSLPAYFTATNDPAIAIGQCASMAGRAWERESSNRCLASAHSVGDLSGWGGWGGGVACNVPIR